MTHQPLPKKRSARPIFSTDTLARIREKIQQAQPIREADEAIYHAATPGEEIAHAILTGQTKRGIRPDRTPLIAHCKTCGEITDPGELCMCGRSHQAIEMEAVQRALNRKVELSGVEAQSMRLLGQGNATERGAGSFWTRLQMDRRQSWGLVMALILLASALIVAGSMYASNRRLDTAFSIRAADRRGSFGSDFRSGENGKR